MFPLLRSGRDEVILSPCCKDELRPIDVILFRYKGKHLLHRILRREGDNLQLQGDGSFVAMENCTLTDVVGKVQTVVRPSGKQISVNSLQWRISSRVWRGTGIFRTFLLRILRR